MSTIVTRAGKGSPLTNTEVDSNFTNLNTDKIEAGTTVTLTNKTLTSPRINEILDTSGNEILGLSPTASATDFLTVKNGIGTGVPLHVYADGPSTNIGLHLQPKGSGLVTISDGTDFNKGIRFRSSSSAASAITLLDAVSTAGRVVTLPDATTTLVGRDTTDTLTNKTINLTSNTLVATSAQILAAVTDETGTGALVFANTPTLVTPILGTPTSGNFSTGTFTWPTFNQNTTGTAAGLSATLATISGGTGLTSFTSGGVVYASSTSALATGSGLTFNGTDTLNIANVVSTGKFGLYSESTGVAFGGISTTNYLRFLVTNAEGMRLTSTGLGIGTSSPAQKLDVNGQLRVGQSVASAYQSVIIENTASNGYARATFNVGLGGANGQADVSYAPGIFFAVGPSANDTTTPIVFRNNNATERMRLDSAGNAGFGVTPSAWLANSKAIQIADTGTAVYSYTSGGTSNEYAFLVNNSFLNTSGNDIYIRNGSAAMYRQLDGTHAWFNAASGTAGGTITFTQAMTLDASGVLFVGGTSGQMTHTSGGAVIYGTTPTNGSGVFPGLLELFDTRAYNSTGPNPGGGITFGYKYNASSAYAAGLSIQGLKENSTDGDYAGALAFFTRPNGALPLERFRFGSAGQLGIGGATYGTAGQVLTSGGSGAAPTWSTPSGISTGKAIAMAIVFGG